MAETLNRGPVSGTAVTAPAKKKPFFVDFYSTAVGKKYVMALTGMIGIGFVVVHMIGNLKMYLGVVNEGELRVYDIDCTASSCVNCSCRSCRVRMCCGGSGCCSSQPY